MCRRSSRRYGLEMSYPSSRGRAPEPLLAVFQRVGAVGLMHFLAGHRRIEAASHHKLFLGAQDVAIMLVERVHHAGLDLVRFAGGDIGDRALALHAIDALEVVLVLERVLRSRLQEGDVEGKPHPVICEQHPHARPLCIRDDPVAFFLDDLVEVSDDHSCYSAAYLVVAVTSRAASVRMSSPLAKVASGVVSGARTLTTSSCAPEVSMMRPFPKARAQISPARSPLPTSTPCIMPRPLSRAPGMSSAICSSVSRSISALVAISFWKLSSFQNFSKATRAVTKACVLPRKVPLCSAGPQMSCSGLISRAAKGRPMPEKLLAIGMRSGSMPISSKLKNVPVRPHPA